MSEIGIAVTNSAPLFATLVIILYLRNIGTLKSTLAKELAPLIFTLTMPIFAFGIIYKIQLDTKDLPVVLLVVAIHILIIVLGYIVGVSANWNADSHGSFLLLVTAYSVGPVVYPFVKLNFGEEIIAKIVLIDIALFVTILLLGPVIGSIFHKGEHFNLWKTLSSILKEPTLIAIFLALVVNVTNASLPKAVEGTVDYIGGSFVFLVTVYIAMSISLPDMRKLKLLVGLVAFRFVTSIAISIVVILVLRPSDLVSAAVLLTMFTCYSALPLAYTDKYELDSELVSQAVVASRVVAYALYPLIIALVKLNFDIT